MLDGVVFAWWLLQDNVASVIRGITRQDVVALGVSFVVSAAIIELFHHTRDRTVRIFKRYAARFRNHGLRNPAVWYSFSLGSVLLIAAALLILVHDLPDLLLWAISLTAVIALIVFTVLGWRARGDSWQREPPPPLRRFAIFYEPATAALVPFIVHKLPEIASRFAPMLERLRDLVSPFFA